jgi:hypothetical protein
MLSIVNSALARDDHANIARLVQTGENTGLIDSAIHRECVVAGYEGHIVDCGIAYNASDSS